RPSDVRCAPRPGGWVILGSHHGAVSSKQRSAFVMEVQDLTLAVRKPIHFGPDRQPSDNIGCVGCVVQGCAQDEEPVPRPMLFVPHSANAYRFGQGEASIRVCSGSGGPSPTCCLTMSYS